MSSVLPPSRRCLHRARDDPQAFAAGQVVQQARAANPALEIIARAHTDEEVEYLTAARRRSHSDG